MRLPPDSKRTLARLLRQIARLLGIDDGTVQVDYHEGQPKKVRPTTTIRLEGAGQKEDRLN